MELTVLCVSFTLLHDLTTLPWTEQALKSADIGDFSEFRDAPRAFGIAKHRAQHLC